MIHAMNDESETMEDHPSEKTDNTDSRIILYDSGRPPLWYRIPAVAIGLLLWWFGALVTATSYFGVDTGIRVNKGGSPLLGFIIIFGLGVAFLFVTFCQMRVYFNPVDRGLYSQGRGFFGWRGSRSLPFTDGCEFHIHYTSVFALGNWELSLKQEGGSSRLLTVISTIGVGSTERLRSFCDLLEANTGLPVVFHERGSQYRR